MLAPEAHQRNPNARCSDRVILQLAECPRARGLAKKHVHCRSPRAGRSVVFAQDRRRLFRRRQRVRESGRERPRTALLVARDPDRRCDTPQRVFNDDPVVLPAEDQTDARIVAGFAIAIVEGREIEVIVPARSGMKAPDFKLSATRHLSLRW